MTADIVFLPSIVLPEIPSSGRAAKKSATSTAPIVRFSVFFRFPRLHFGGFVLYYTPFAPDAGRGAGSQGQ